ncbi:uncharacterized protein LOC142331802 [Lycorma delicatula]|uniref:uncharacterized protein LOC142331802 n=1 Tax=Lycorma delicatula TaxID=130591 RepID=UPI003F517730
MAFSLIEYIKKDYSTTKFIVITMTWMFLGYNAYDFVKIYKASKSDTSDEQTQEGEKPNMNKRSLRTIIFVIIYYVIQLVGAYMENLWIILACVCIDIYLFVTGMWEVLRYFFNDANISLNPAGFIYCVLKLCLSISLFCYYRELKNNAMSKNANETTLVN